MILEKTKKTIAVAIKTNMVELDLSLENLIDIKAFEGNVLSKLDEAIALIPRPGPVQSEDCAENLDAQMETEEEPEQTFEITM